MTPGISPPRRDPARLIWNIYPSFAAHSIYPVSSPRSSLLLLTFHLRQTPAWLCLNFMKGSAATLTNILTLPLSLWGILTKPTSGRSCRTFTSMYSVQLEDRIHWIIATLFKNAYKARSLPAFGKSDHAAIFLTPEYKQRLTQESPVKREEDALVLPLRSYAAGGS